VGRVRGNWGGGERRVGSKTDKLVGGRNWWRQKEVRA